MENFCQKNVAAMVMVNITIKKEKVAAAMVKDTMKKVKVVVVTISRKDENCHCHIKLEYTGIS